MHVRSLRGRPGAVLLTGICLIAGAAGCAGSQDGAASDAPGNPIDEWIAPLAEGSALSGILLVAEGDSVVYERALGRVRYPAGASLRPDIPMSVASITKPMTQIILLKLIEAEILDLADTVSRWLPEFSHGSRMSVSDLARHRSGIPHRVTDPDDENVRRTPADMVSLASAVELAFSPGDDRLYSSAGYSVLARVLEVASGRSYAELLSDYVLEPVGATRVRDASGGPPPGGAIGHFDPPGGPTPAPEKDLSFLVGAGSAYATPRDLFRIARGVLDGTYGDLVTQNLVTEDGEIHWNGITNGNRAFLDYDPASKRMVVFTSNVFNGATDLVRSEIPRIASGERVPRPSLPVVEPYALSESTRALYEGAYEFGSPDDTELLEFLSPELARLGTWLLVPIAETHFFSPQDWAEVEVELTSDGSVEALRWGDEGGARFPRSPSDPGTG